MIWRAFRHDQEALPGIYNIAEPCNDLSTEKAQRVLGVDPDFRFDARVGEARCAPCGRYGDSSSDACYREGEAHASADRSRSEA